MVYINVAQDNEFTLNINNNVRDPFPGDFEVKSISIHFKHILSDRDVIDTANVWSTDVSVEPLPNAIWGTYNDRYIEFLAEQEYLTGLVYDGEYKVSITNEDGVNLYHGIWKITGNSEIEENPFVEYQSDNEDNNSYIYIEE